jgi:hypothetical protein
MNRPVMRRHAASRSAPSGAGAKLGERSCTAPRLVREWLARRCAWILTLLAAWPAVALAQSPSESCLLDHKRVQTERQSGRYLQARDAAHRCAQSSCPQLVREDCAAWYVDIERSVPTLLFEVRDPRGRDLVDVTVSEHGRPVAGAASGRATAFDPGHHRLRIEAPGYPPEELDLMVREGTKNRTVSVTLRSSHARAQEPVSKRPGRMLTPSVLALGTVTTVALTAYAALGVAGRVALQRVDHSGCKPDCSRAQVNDLQSINRMYTAANIAAGIGVAAALTTAVVYFTSRGEAARPPKLGWNARGDARGASVTLRGTF